MYKPFHEEKIRVLQICRSIYTAKILLISLANALKEQGYDVEFACSLDGKSLGSFKFPINKIHMPKILNPYVAFR